MYQNYYRFKEKPFSLTPDPKFLYLSKQHQGALDHMLYGIRQREGFIVVVGDVGMGKTTLCRCLLGRLEDNINVALVLNPMLSDMDLLRTCVHDLGVHPSPVKVGETDSSGDGGWVDATVMRKKHADSEWVNRASKKELVDALNALLLDQYRVGGSTVLIIDEAQNLSQEVMEQLRILSNLETEKEKLLQIIFVGQLELNQKLQLPQLKQLNQRISIRYEITQLSKSETIKYINHRILVAGAGSRIAFTHFALNEIFAYSNGYPRLINLVCDRALLAGFNAQVDTIDRSHVNQGIRSLLGEEDKSYFFARMIKDRLPVIASILFFMAGLALFLLPRVAVEKNPQPSRMVTEEKLLAQAGKYGNKKTESGSPSNETVLTGANSGSPSEKPSAIPAPIKTETPEKEIAQAPDRSRTGAEQTAVGKNNGKYRIQVFSLSHQNRAEKEVQNLRSEGYQAYWKKAVSTEQDWYIVYVGPFENIKPARIHLKSLKYSGRSPILLSVSQAR